MGQEIDTVDKKQKQEQKENKTLLFVLLVISSAGYYYCLDIPSVLKEQIIRDFKNQYDYQTAELYYSLMYSLVTLPNMVFPFIVGYLTDKLGVKIMMLCQNIFMTVGQMIVVWGTIVLDFNVIIFGRFVFGIGQGSYDITNNIMVINLFEEDELSFYLGIFISCFKLICISNTLISPYLSQQFNGTVSVQSFGLIVCSLSLITTIVLFYLDNPQQNQNQNQQESQSIGKIFKKVKNLQILFWIYTIITATSYCCLVTFQIFSSGIIIQDYLPSTNSLQKNQEIAGMYMSLVLILAIIFFPINGWIIDKIGQRITAFYLSAILIIAALVIMLDNKLLVLPLLMAGLSYSIFGAVIWSSIVYLVPQEQYGLGIGILLLIQNLGLGIGPILATSVKSYYRTNQSIIVLLIIIAIIFLFSTISMDYFDRKRTISLNDSSQQKLYQCLQQQYQNLDHNHDANDYFQQINDS